MTTQIKRRRGTASQHGSFTGAEAEITVNTTNESIHVHDGSTAGGFETARADGTNVSNFAVGGTLNVAGAFTSLGIDDNADATAITIGSDEVVDFASNADFIDGRGIRLGNGNDFQLYHDGTNNYINGTTSTNMLFLTNGAERMRIDGSSGNVGIGISNPSSYDDGGDRLVVGNTSARSGMTIVSSTSTAGSVHFADGTGNTSYRGILSYYHDNDSMRFSTSATERLRLDSAGRMLLGTTTEGEGNADDLTVANTGHCGITIRSGTSAEGSLLFSDGTSGADEYRGYVQYLHSANALRFGSNAVERMRIFSGGQVGIADGTAPESAAMLDVKRNSGDIVYFRNNGGTGVKLTAGNQSFSAVSDENKKENIVELNKQQSYDNVKNIRAVTYNFKDIVKDDVDGNTITYEDDKSRIGFISQDWETNYSELVDTDDDGVKSLLYTETVPVLLSALQKAQDKIEAMEARITSLENGE